ncbi:MAG: 30S ribosomal protein S17 [Sulfolobales archaeon]|nr:30S ribosomal protein S17 [Sulfolobales archaeon]MDW8083197.1 30S ribosomal protein S17 [Sulfolobales archaeon]
MSEGVKAKNIGIDYKGLNPPQEVCSDIKCPWHGHLKVRGGLLVGRVYKARAQKMVIVEREFLVYVRKFRRYEKRRSRIHAYLPPCIKTSPGDKVLIGETRPLAKSVAWVVLGVLSGGV